MSIVLVGKAICIAIFAAIYVVYLWPYHSLPSIKPLKTLDKPPAHVVYLKTHSTFYTLYTLEKVRYHYDDSVKTAHRLLGNAGAIEVERVNEKQIRVAAMDEELFSDADFPLRMETRNYKEGQTFNAGTFSVEVLSLREGIPSELSVTFKVPMENIVFITYAGDYMYKRVSLPIVGSSLTF